MATVAALEKEIKIPARRLQQAFLQKDKLPEYRDHILQFLHAFEHGDGEALEVLQSGQETVLPPAHTTQVYTLEVLTAIHARQRKLSQGAERPHCLIVRNDISVRQCLASQNPRDCYGCAAATRFCAECKLDPIAFQGAELCSYCLSKKLRDPKTDQLNQSWVVHVQCHLSKNREITAATCQRMQSEACGSCNAITRICLTCKSRRVRYPDFGMCLQCHTELMGPGWEPLSEVKLTAVEAEREKFFAQQPLNVPPVAAIVVTQQPTLTVVVTEQIEEVPSPVPLGVPDKILEDPRFLSAALTYELSRMWAAIQEQHQGVPNAVILLAKYLHGEQRGEFSAMRWEPKEGHDGSLLHEVAVYTTVLNQSAEVVLETLLHEAAHARNFERGVKDCSANQYHNRRFQSAAESLGLDVEQVDHYGFARTSLKSGTASRYADVLGGLRQLLLHKVETDAPARAQDRAWYSERRPQAENIRKGRSLKASCQCGFIIRVTKKTMRDTVIRCDTCGQPFRLS